MNIDKLTPELLGKVLAEEVYEIDWESSHQEMLFYIVGRYDKYHKGDLPIKKVEESINLDTLTRKMKEYCYTNDVYVFSGINDLDELPTAIISKWKNNNTTLEREVFKADNEFEAVLEALLWVEKQRG